MRDLLPTLGHDATLLRVMSDTIDEYRALRQPALLLDGSESADFQRFSIAALAEAIPHARQVELTGLNHGSAWNYDKRRNPKGNPNRVAEELRKFFLS